MSRISRILDLLRSLREENFEGKDLSFQVFQHLSSNLLFPPSERMEEGRDSRSVLQCKRHLWVPSSRYTQALCKISPPPVRSNCDHFALRNPPLIGSNYPPTGSRSLRTKAKPTIRLEKKGKEKKRKEKRRKKIVSFETRIKDRRKRDRRNNGVPPLLSRRKIAGSWKASPRSRSARKSRGTLTRDWEVQPIV